MNGAWCQGWSWGRNEPELISLYEWIDSHQSTYAGGSRGGIVGGIIGGLGGLMGGTIGTLAGAFHINPDQHPWVIVAPLGIYLMAIAGTLCWYFRGRTQDERVLARSSAEMRSFLWKLMSARWSGGVTALIGAEAAQALNSGAYECLRCRTVLNSPAWKAVATNSPWAKSREQTRTAMEVTMARLVTMVGQGAPPSDSAVVALLADMKAAADEATRSSARLANQHGLAVDASDELRKALGDMRALGQADEEFDRMTRGL